MTTRLNALLVERGKIADQMDNLHTLIVDTEKREYTAGREGRLRRSRQDLQGSRREDRVREARPGAQGCGGRAGGGAGADAGAQWPGLRRAAPHQRQEAQGVPRQLFGNNQADAEDAAYKPACGAVPRSTATRARRSGAPSTTSRSARDELRPEVAEREHQQRRRLSRVPRDVDGDHRSARDLWHGAAFPQRRADGVGYAGHSASHRRPDRLLRDGRERLHRVQQELGPGAACARRRSAA
jgi:hypothetical protein